MKLKQIILIAVISYLLIGCLKEMPDKELTVSIESEDPIRNLQKLTPDEFKTNVMILGVPPLNVLRKDFSPSLLDSLIFSLKKFNPSLICIDGISPREIEAFQHIDEFHSKLVNSIASKEISLAEHIRKKYKINYSNALEEIDSLLKKDNTGNSLSLKDRTDLVKNLIAVYDVYSASLQWSYLTDEEKLKAEIDPSIKNELEQILNSNDENSSIGIRLARELKLQRLFPINDYSDKFYLDKISDKLYEEMLISEVYLNSRKDILDYQTDKKLKESLAKKNLLPFFEHLNSMDYIIKSTNKNWGIYYKMFLDSGLDRTRIALWEMKCLRIAANIREISSFYPGKNILVIIDVSAKPFLEDYLKSIGDVRITSLQDIN